MTPGGSGTYGAGQPFHCTLMKSPFLPTLCAVVSLAAITQVHADFFDFFKKKTTDTLGKEGSSLSALSEQQVTKGLKEALAKGVRNAVTNLGKEGGYLNNSKVKIPMPEKLQQIERGLRAAGQEQMADEFITTMNRAAEAAVPQAADIFASSIQEMTLADAKSLVNGPDDAATQYFRKTGEAKLEEKMLPIIKEKTSATGVTATYKKMTDKVGFVGGLFGGGKSDLDIDQYVTDKAADGFFAMMAEQEKEIRKNPAARTSDLLQKVFGR